MVPEASYYKKKKKINQDHQYYGSKLDAFLVRATMFSWKGGLHTLYRLFHPGVGGGKCPNYVLDLT